MFWNGKIGLFTSSCNCSNDLARKSFALRHVSCSANIKSARCRKKKRVPELLWERSLCWAPDACREKTFGCGQVKQPESTSNTCPAQHQEEGGVAEVGGGGFIWLHLSGAKLHRFRSNHSHFCSQSYREKYHISAGEESPDPAVSPLRLLHGDLALVSYSEK